MLQTTKLNNICIEPVIDNSKRDPKKILGYDYFNEPYCNVMLNARKQSGKSTVIFRSLEKCAAKGMNVLLFSSTVNNDPTYKKMIKMLVKKGCNVKTFDHFIDNNGMDHIKILLDLLSKGDDNKAEEEDKPQHYPVFANELNENPRKPKKKKNMIIKPEYILVFDDLSTSMRHPSISRLLTKNRHFKMKVFVACHSINNLDLMARNCVDVAMLFPNIPEDKVIELTNTMGLDFKTDTKKDKMIMKLYDFATCKPYNFLYIDKENFKFRRNFSEMINI